MNPSNSLSSFAVVLYFNSNKFHCRTNTREIYFSELWNYKYKSLPFMFQPNNRPPQTVPDAFKRQGIYQYIHLHFYWRLFSWNNFFFGDKYESIIVNNSYIASKQVHRKCKLILHLLKSKARATKMNVAKRSNRIRYSQLQHKA